MGIARVLLAPTKALDNTLTGCRGFRRTDTRVVRRIMEGNMVSFMGSLVYDWLLSAGDDKLAKKFKKEANPEPLPPNSPRLADIVKHYKETTPRVRDQECRDRSRVGQRQPHKVYRRLSENANAVSRCDREEHLSTARVNLDRLYIWVR